MSFDVSQSPLATRLSLMHGLSVRLRVWVPQTVRSTTGYHVKLVCASQRSKLCPGTRNTSSCRDLRRRLPRRDIQGDMRGTYGENKLHFVRLDLFKVSVRGEYRGILPFLPRMDGRGL